MAHAVRMEQYGSPEVLVHAAAELPDLGPCEVRIRTRFAAVNYTDLHIRSGDWPIRKQPPFPYTPGVEAVGIIEAMGTDVDDWQVGQSVITMMQGLGGVRAERPGSYADFVTVDSNALAGIPGQVAPADMAALGLAGVTAFEGLRKLGPLDGRRIAITGAAGGVGSAATAIARGLGASVLALVTNTGDVDYVRKLGATDAIVVAKGAKPAVELQTCDGVLDTVGGPLFGPCVDALSDGGVLCLVGAVAGGDVAFDAWQLVRPVTITGYSTETLDGAALQRTVNALAALLDRKAIAIPDYRIMPLHQAAHAHALLEQRHVRGRILLQP